jgi:hypothetical protein
LISVSKACRYDGTVLPMSLHLHKVFERSVFGGKIHAEWLNVWMTL